MTQSPEVAGGAGFDYEGAVAAVYLAGLLAEGTAPGVDGRRVVRVALQQAGFAQPLDDLVVESEGVGAERSTLSLQVKRELVLSAAPSNKDFRSIVAESWRTLQKPTFRPGVDRLGAATSVITDKRKRDAEAVFQLARDAPTLADWEQRAAKASNARGKVIGAFRSQLERSGEAVSESDLHRLLAHFTIVRLDVLDCGSADCVHALNALRGCLAPEEADRASALWDTLRVLARSLTASAGAIDRPTLVNRLRGMYRLAGARSAAGDIQTLVREARLGLDGIARTVGDTYVERTALIEQVEQAIRRNRFVQITGLPGSGKSALLRQLVERRLAEGPVIFLKADRLAGPTWAHHATAWGLATRDIAPLLIELAAVGHDVLFVDGLDRVEHGQHHVILDLLHEMLRSKALANWRVVTTLRNNEIESVQAWLPPELLRGGLLASVEVGPFDDAECQQLAGAQPYLMQMLFADGPAQEIARRPFFAKILAGRASGVAAGSDCGARSEVQLMDAWWRDAGVGQSTRLGSTRCLALRELARRAAADRGRHFGLEDLSDGARDVLLEEGVIRLDETQLRGMFAHDVFFEWSFAKHLLAAGDDWLRELTMAGEAPMLARAVELHSQATLKDSHRWVRYLVQAETGDVRSQWTRSWLLGPFCAADFSANEPRYSAALFDVARPERLQRLVVWFQAEKTQPNERILHGPRNGFSDRQAVEWAYELAWTADVATWVRFCAWLLDHVHRLPEAVVPDTIAVFEVWMTSSGVDPNSMSIRILKQARTWLDELEDATHSHPLQSAHGRWTELSRDLHRNVETRLRGLLLRASAMPGDIVGGYLQRLHGSRALLVEAIRQLWMSSPSLGGSHAKALVDLSLEALIDELPKTQRSRMRGRGYFPLEDTGILDHHGFHYEFEGGWFSPASPLREPFPSLFGKAPEEALRLVRSVSNHAMAAWRQSRGSSFSHSGTPVPLTLRYPWGSATYWGDGAVYAWFRGFGPSVVTSGLMALESWALNEIAGGRNVDSVVEDVVRGHEGCAVLGIAVALMLHTGQVSAVTLPLVTSQRIWDWDISRCAGDAQSHWNLMGLDVHDAKHGQAVRNGNALPIRRLDVRALVCRFVLSADPQIAAAARAAIARFPQDLPYETQEQSQDGDAVARLREQALMWADLGDAANYHEEPSPDGTSTWVVYRPRHRPSEHLREAVARVKERGNWNGRVGWVLQSIESSESIASVQLADLRAAVGLCRTLDAGALLSSPHAQLRAEDLQRSYLAGVASLILVSEQPIVPEDLAWAADTVLCAATVNDDVPSRYRDVKVIDHPCRLAVPGLGGMLRRGLRASEAQETLLRLGGARRQDVSVMALSEALRSWATEPRLAVVALNLALRLSAVPRRAWSYAGDGVNSAQYQAHSHGSVELALLELAAPTPPRITVRVPSAWIAPADVGDELDDDEWAATPIHGWKPGDVLRWDVLGPLLDVLPLEHVTQDAHFREPILCLLEDLVVWTLDELQPPWRTKDTEDERNPALSLGDWMPRLFRVVARVVVLLEPAEARRRFVQRLVDLRDGAALVVLAHFASALACYGVMDASVIHEEVVAVLRDVAARTVASREAQRLRWDPRALGYELMRLLPALLFVEVDRAPESMRFANGDWRDVRVVLPVVDRIVRELGCVPDVARHFLTLCERAEAHYPADELTAQVLHVFRPACTVPAHWRGTDVPRRLGNLIGRVADLNRPLSESLAQDMLRVLDALIDVGDRRSAALQRSEIFKDVRRCAPSKPASER